MMTAAHHDDPVSETPAPDEIETTEEPDVDESDEGPGFLAILEEDDVASPASPAKR